MPATRPALAVLGTALLALLALLLAAAADAPESRSAEQQALTRFNPLIGGWRGVGQPRRGSARGAWSEKAEWVWEFDKKDKKKKGKNVGIRYKSTGSKLLTDGLFGFDTRSGRFTLQAVFADKTRRKYTGRPAKDGTLVLESDTDKSGHVYRMTIRQLNPKRTLILHERRRAKSKFFSRVAGIGFTRAGTRLAASDASGPLCIVTEGLGTSKVSYKGKSYWICCSGCRDAFLADPEGILADARQRAAERKKKRDKKE